MCVCALSPFKNVQEAFAPGCAFTPLEALQDTFLLKPSALIQAIQERWTAGGLAFRRGGVLHGATGVAVPHPNLPGPSGDRRAKMA